MKKKYSILLVLVLALLTAFFGVPGEEEAYIPAAEDIVAAQILDDGSTLISPDGIYTSKEDVALYIHTYGCLPQNFMTKDEARVLGWEGGSLEEFAPGMCIGGDRFGNYEGLLPDDRDYTECDIIMYHEAHIGLINTHPESYCCYNHINVFLDEIVLHGRTYRRIHPGVISTGIDAISFQDFGQFFHFLTAQTIDNT